MNSRKILYYKITAVLLIILLFTSCGKEIQNNQLLEEENTGVWYIQSEVDLGSRITMKNADFGFAISRGRGEDVKGKAYTFNEGKWKEFASYNYSDFPLAAEYKEGIYWYLIHEVHYNNYKPRLYQFNSINNEITEIPLPIIKWDEKDYAMWKDMQIMEDGTAWLVGQQGHIAFFNGSVWEEYESPVKKYEPEKLWAGDLNSIFMIDNNNGWAVGRNGIILNYKDGIWSIYQEGIEVEYFDVLMIDNEGWIVGSNSKILKYENGKWIDASIKSRAALKSIAALNKNDVWVCGERSTLLHYDGKNWKQVKDVQIFEDGFNDISVILDENNNKQIWIMGSNAIYSISQSFGFSFTQITSQVGLRREGTIAIPIELNNDDFTDLIIMMEDTSPLFYENLGNGDFREIALSSTGIENPIIANTASVGDINNDGHDDLILISMEGDFSIYIGKGGISFKDITEYSEIEINLANGNADSQAKFVDLNNDGNLDLYLSFGNDNDLIFQNDGTGKFTNVYESSGINKVLNRRGFGVVFTDLNNDNLIDLFMGYRFPLGESFYDVYINKGNFKFDKLEIDHKLPEVKFPISAVSIDYNNDGNNDIFVMTNTNLDFILENDGRGNFKYLDKEIGFSQAVFHPEPVNGVVAACDINNDGFTDLFLGSQLFINNNGFFENITPHIGLNFIGNPTFMDFDNDLDYDLFIGSSRFSLGDGNRFGLFRNNLVNKNAVGLTIYADKSNRSAIGSSIKLKNENGVSFNKQLGVGLNPLDGGYTRRIILYNNSEYNSEIEVRYPSGKIINKNLYGSENNITIYESNLLDRFSTLSYKSIERTIKLFNPLTDLLKLFFFLTFFSVVYFYSKKTKASKVTNTWYFPLASFLIFILLYHFSINTTFLFELAATVLIPAIIVFGFIYAVNNHIEKKESKFISHYKILEILGVGGMGKVFKALDTQTKNIVAIKIINPELTKDEENKKRLSSEGRLLSSISHPQIVKVFEISETEKHTFIAMEYLDGGTLYDVIQNEYPLPLNRFKEIIFQICDGLHFIHSKEIIHRDLKSQNIMFDGDKNLRIMDFGLSKSPLVSTMTSLGTVVGTLGYVAPEQVTGIEVDSRTDIFSLGVIMYQMITKELPFNGENEIALIHSIFNTQPKSPSELNGNSLKELDAIILKALAKEPGDRYNNVFELKTELNRIN
jgi:photosystem II stability/assembly factor-like uncharacterized protein